MYTEFLQSPAQISRALSKCAVNPATDRKISGGVPFRVFRRQIFALIPSPAGLGNDHASSLTFAPANNRLFLMPHPLIRIPVPPSGAHGQEISTVITGRRGTRSLTSPRFGMRRSSRHSFQPDRWLNVFWRSVPVVKSKALGGLARTLVCRVID